MQPKTTLYTYNFDLIFSFLSVYVDIYKSKHNHNPATLGKGKKDGENRGKTG